MEAELGVLQFVRGRNRAGRSAYDCYRVNDRGGPRPTRRGPRRGWSDHARARQELAFRAALLDPRTRFPTPDSPGRLRTSDRLFVGIGPLAGLGSRQHRSPPHYISSPLRLDRRVPQTVDRSGCGGPIRALRNGDHFGSASTLIIAWGGGGRTNRSKNLSVRIERPRQRARPPCPSPGRAATAGSCSAAGTTGGLRRPFSRSVADLEPRLDPPAGLADRPHRTPQFFLTACENRDSIIIVDISGVDGGFRLRRIDPDPLQRRSWR
jgi:hypothetical protein